jgi:hypothetical protein
MPYPEIRMISILMVKIGLIVAAINWKGFGKELLKKLKNINNEQKAEAELALIIKKCQENKSQSFKQRIVSNNQQHFVHHAKKRTQLEFVPRSLSNSIVDNVHNSQGYFGTYKTYKQIKATFYWKGTKTQEEVRQTLCSVSKDENSKFRNTW